MKSFFRTVLDYDPEQEHLVASITRIAKASGKARILDVGCGYGRNLRRLIDAGFDAIGVEVNEEIVAANRTNGLPCMSVAEFNSATSTFDILVLSHVVEHFAPNDLLPFIDGYLDRLAPGGHLVIATPLVSPYFYVDFDHVKPYLPQGILSVFGVGQSQVQYYSRNKLALEDVWFRKSYPRFTLVRSKYVKTPFTKVLSALEVGSAAVAWLSRGTIGQVDGWVGVFKKV